MNSYIDSYIKQAAAFFPVIGKPERSYLAQLSHSIEDYFSENKPDSPEKLIQVFGRPQSIVRDYLAHSDTQRIVARIRMRKYTRLCAMTVLCLCLMVVLLIAVHFGWQLRALHEVERYDPPVYSADGTRLE